MTATREAFLVEYRRRIVETYGADWAHGERLERFMGTVARSFADARPYWHWDTDTARATWRAIGAAGRMTMRGLWALPAAVTAEGGAR